MRQFLPCHIGLCVFDIQMLEEALAWVHFMDNAGSLAYSYTTTQTLMLFSLLGELYFAIVKGIYCNMVFIDYFNISTVAEKQKLKQFVFR